MNLKKHQLDDARWHISEMLFQSKEWMDGQWKLQNWKFIWEKYLTRSFISSSTIETSSPTLSLD